MLSVSRYLFLSKGTRFSSFLRSSKAVPGHSLRNATDQMDCIKYASEEPNTDWVKLKSVVLSMPGSVNQKNFEGITIKTLINSQQLDTALSYANFLTKSNEELSLGALNGLFGLYHELGKRNQLTEQNKMFILEMHNKLYQKYKILDYTTAEKLLHALCVIDEYQKSFKVLEDITASSIPSHSAYSTLISTLFRNNKNSEAMAMIERSLKDRRPLLDIAYNGWIQYTLKNYKQKRTRVKHIDEICTHIANNFVTIKQETAERIKHTYKSLGWKAQFSAIDKSGQCKFCKQSLDHLSLSKEEFQLLQANVKEKLIVGSDLFLKTSPDELKRFMIFFEKTAPYDFVLDALNIAYASSRQESLDKANLLCEVVNNLVEQNKKIMVLGRKHMLRWPKRNMQYIMSNTHSFFTDNISQDDPFFITAAIMSGPETDIVSKDLLRGHLFRLNDEKLRILFRRWQWQHQWMVFTDKRNGIVLQEPPSFTPTAQKKNDGWHLPYEKDSADNTRLSPNGLPDMSSWLCIQPTEES